MKQIISDFKLALKKNKYITHLLILDSCFMPKTRRILNQRFLKTEGGERLGVMWTHQYSPG